MNSRKRIAVVVAIAALALPSIGFAQTTSVQTQVQTLLLQIQAPQVQLKALLASSTVSVKWQDHDNNATSTAQGGEDRVPKPCVQILHELKKGARGDEVSALQKFLQSDASTGFKGAVTGFFGQLTATALAKFELHEGIASTTPGVLATSTRDHLAKPCPPLPKNDHDTATSTRPLPPIDGDHSPRPSVGALIRGAALVTGTVTQNAGTSISIQTDGGLKTVLVGSTTIVSSTSASSTIPTTITVAGITVGVRARAIGTTNSDGTITANVIQIGDLRPINF